MFFGPNLHKKGVIMGHEWKIFSLAETRKADYQLSETFYFIKIYVLTELWIFFFILSDVFFQKGVFPAKAAVSSGYRNAWVEIEG